MAITAQDKLRVKKLVRELKSYRTPHTELVTVYIPAGYELSKVTQHLNEENGTAANIKSATTRKNVQGALEKMIQHLRQYAKTPERGLVAFSGNVAAAEGKNDFRSWVIEPPMPLNTRIYRCDKMFVTDILEDMLLDHHVYGLVVLDNRDATLALLKGKTFTILQKTHSEVPGKMKAGGQSAHRFDQNRKNAIVQHYKKICEYMKEQFLVLGTNLKGIIIGGPGVTINDFLNHEYLTGDLQRKVLGTKDLSYTDEFGVQELVDRSEDLLAEEAIMDEKKAMTQFFMTFRENPKKITYGEKETMRVLEMNAVDTLYLSESLPEDLVFSLSEKAEAGGSTVIVISVETREGVQLRDLGGIGAILRFEVEPA